MILYFRRLTDEAMIAVREAMLHVPVDRYGVVRGYEADTNAGIMDELENDNGMNCS